MVKLKYSVNNPPGNIENRVFIGGSYILMPILREIEETVEESGFQPIIAYDFDIPKEKTREYTLRLLYQCGYAILEETLAGGHIVELARASGFNKFRILQIYMCMDERRDPPSSLSIMVWQTEPLPYGYVTINELKDIVLNFLTSENNQ